MNKSILVIDTPDCCNHCFLGKKEFNSNDVVCRAVKGFCVSERNAIPYWCPLKDVPQKMAEENRWYSEDYAKGRNDCIDEILKGVAGNG